jgi:hypothetical protein
MSYQVDLSMNPSDAMEQTARPKWTCSLWTHHPTELDIYAGAKGGDIFPRVPRRSDEHGCNFTRGHRG